MGVWWCAWHHKYDKRLTYYQGLRVVKERLLVSSNFGDKLSSKTRIKPPSPLKAASMLVCPKLFFCKQLSLVVNN